MTANEVVATLNRISYKPDVTVSWNLNHEGLYFSLSRMVDDSTGRIPYKENVHSRSFISRRALSQFSEETLVGTIRHQVRGFELHEVDEWFKFDGKCVVDPHPEESQLRGHLPNGIVMDEAKTP